MSSSGLSPMMSIDIAQAIIFTPCSRAEAMRSSSGMTFSWRIIRCMSLGPAPAKFMCESLSRSGPRGIMAENAFCKGLLPLVATFSGRRRAFRPQNVKNMVTSSSIAAAPLAMMKAAITLSKSPLKTMIVFRVLTSVLSLTASTSWVSVIALGRPFLGSRWSRNHSRGSRSSANRAELCQRLRELPHVAHERLSTHRAQRRHLQSLGRNPFGLHQLLSLGDDPTRSGSTVVQQGALVAVGADEHPVEPLLERVQDPSGLEPAAARDVHCRDLSWVVHVPASGQVDAGIGDVVRREDQDPRLEPGIGSSGHAQLTWSSAGTAAGSRRRRPNP